MTKASDNAFPSILITEGTEPSAPAAGKQRLYIDSTTHKLKRTDSSGTDVTIESAGGSVASDTIWDAAGDLAVGTGADTAAKLTKGSDGTVLTVTAGTVGWATPAHPVLYDDVFYTTGDITLGSGTSMVVLSGPGDNVLTAVAGDLLMVGVSCYSNDTDADSLGLDVATIVSAATVNFLSSRTSTAATTGVPGWYMGASRKQNAGCEIPYIVQSGDISGGTVTLRLYYRVSGVGKVLGASTTSPLLFWARNLGQ